MVNEDPHIGPKKVPQGPSSVTTEAAEEAVSDLHRTSPAPADPTDTKPAAAILTGGPEEEKLPREQRQQLLLPSPSRCQQQGQRAILLPCTASTAHTAPHLSSWKPRPSESSGLSAMNDPTTAGGSSGLCKGSFSGSAWWDGWRISAQHCECQTSPQGWLLAQSLRGILREQQRVSKHVNKRC